jgi:hypothetical protein
MGYRSFTDSRGTRWQAWDVVPQLAERRVAQRRVAPTSAPVERRHRAERRLVAGRRPSLNSGLGSGWLCFDAQVEKRRLSPIPEDWLRCPEERLEQYCAQAKRAQRPSIPMDLR